MIWFLLSVILVVSVIMLSGVARMRVGLAVFEKRLEHVEQNLKMVAGVVDDTLTAVTKARIAAQGSELNTANMLKATHELTEVIKKAVEDTPELPFAPQQAMMGRVSAIRHFLRRKEEESAR